MDTLTLFFERSNAMQTYWNFYITVVLGLVGFFAAAKLKRPRNVQAATLLTAGFLGFVVVNLNGLSDVARQRMEASLALAHMPANERLNADPKELDADRWSSIHVRIADPLPMTLSPPTVRSVVWFHVLSDILVVSSLWFLALSKAG